MCRPINLEMEPVQRPEVVKAAAVEHRQESAEAALEVPMDSSRLKVTRKGIVRQKYAPAEARIIKQNHPTTNRPARLRAGG